MSLAQARGVDERTRRAGWGQRLLSTTTATCTARRRRRVVLRRCRRDSDYRCSLVWTRFVCAVGRRCIVCGRSGGGWIGDRRGGVSRRYECGRECKIAVRLGRCLTLVTHPLRPVRACDRLSSGVRCASRPISHSLPLRSHAPARCTCTAQLNCPTRSTPRTDRLNERHGCCSRETSIRTEGDTGEENMSSHQGGVLFCVLFFFPCGASARFFLFPFRRSAATNQTRSRPVVVGAACAQQHSGPSWSPSNLLRHEPPTVKANASTGLDSRQHAELLAAAAHRLSSSPSLAPWRPHS